MPSLGTNVPRYELSVPRGSGAKIRLAVTKGGAPYDLALPGTVLVVTARHRGVLQFQHVYVEPSTTLPPGLVDDGADFFEIDPADDPGINVARCRVAMEDTADLETSDVLAWDAWLYTSEPDPVPIAVGTMRVEALPYQPA